MTHGGIDGFSRLITYLGCATSNDSGMVLRLFVTAATAHGLPSRVRSDHGYENLHVAFLMNIVRGARRGSHITGESVHNQRIERLWKDVHKEVTGPFYTQFYALEDAGLLSPDNALHRFVLQQVFLKEINDRLQTFRLAWNHHRLRSEANRTPEQIWLDGMLAQQNSSHTSTNEVFAETDSVLHWLRQGLEEYGVDSNDNVESISRDENSISSPLLTSEQSLVLNAALAGTYTALTDKFSSCLDALLAHSNDDQ